MEESCAERLARLRDLLPKGSVKHDDMRVF